MPELRSATSALVALFIANICNKISLVLNHLKFFFSSSQSSSQSSSPISYLLHAFFKLQGVLIYNGLYTGVSRDVPGNTVHTLDIIQGP